MTYLSPTAPEPTASASTTPVPAVSASETVDEPTASPTEPDVVIVGAGPIGLAAALLADYGVRVTVVERHPSTGDEPRAISITDETLRVMQQLGVLDKLEPEMLLDTGARYFGHNDQLLAEVHPAAPRLGHPGKSQFDQPVLEELLRVAAQQRLGSQLRFSTEVVALTAFPDTTSRVSVTVRPVGDDGAPVEGAAATVLRPRWILGADGGRSFVRSALGIGLVGSTQVEKWIVLDLLGATEEPEPFAEFHCNGVRPVVVVPGVISLSMRSVSFRNGKAGSRGYAF